MAAVIQIGSVQLSGAKTQKLRILLVEDKPAAAARLKAQLEDQGHHVVGVARNGRQAIDCVWKLRPGLIIIELWLAGIDGIEVARTILASEPLPVVLLVGHDAGEFMRRAREVGIMACSVTSADARHLAAIIDVALARFEEFQAIRRETADLAEALVVRNEVEQAKKVLMRRLKVPEAEAFRRLCRARTTVSGLGEVAVAVCEIGETAQGRHPRSTDAGRAARDPSGTESASLASELRRGLTARVARETSGDCSPA